MLFNTLVMSLVPLGLRIFSTVNALPDVLLGIVIDRLVSSHGSRPVVGIGPMGDPHHFPIVTGTPSVALSHKHEPSPIAYKGIASLDKRQLPPPGFQSIHSEFHPERTTTFPASFFTAAGVPPPLPTVSQDDLIARSGESATAVAKTGKNTIRIVATNETADTVKTLAFLTYDACPVYSASIAGYIVQVPPDDGFYTVTTNPSFMFLGKGNNGGVTALWLCNGEYGGTIAPGPDNVCVLWYVSEIGIGFCAPSGLPGDGMIRTIYVDPAYTT